MIFTPENVKLVLSGKKTQTRRLVHVHETFQKKSDANLGAGIYITYRWGSTKQDSEMLKYGIGRTYAIQPGRGKKAVSRLRITSIEMQNLNAITDAEAKKEGYRDREEFQAVWSLLHQRPKTRWSYNPEVWVISFEVLK